MMMRTTSGPCNDKPWINPQSLPKEYPMSETTGVELLKCNNKVYLPQKAGPWNGYQEIKAVDVTSIKPKWNGKKIPFELWKQILSFFQWSFEVTKSETVVHLYYHDIEGWVALVLPQRGWTGMTIKTLPDHPNVVPTLQRLGGTWGVVSDDGTDIVGKPMGTVHHHCSAGAFQSGTDHSDEQKQEGIHITVGNLNDKKFSIHSRISFRGEFSSDPVLSEWFELEPNILEILPNDATLLETVIKHRLTTPSVNVEFPDWWKENVIKVEEPASAMGFQHRGNTGYAGHGHRCYYPSHGVEVGRAATFQGGNGQIWDKALGKFVPYKPTETIPYHGAPAHRSFSNWRIDKDIEDLLDHNFSLEDVLQVLEKLNDSPKIKQLIDAMAENMNGVSETISSVKDMIRDKEEEDFYMTKVEVAAENCIEDKTGTSSVDTPQPNANSSYDGLASYYDGYDDYGNTPYNNQLPIAGGP